jgi:uncharacterized protein
MPIARRVPFVALLLVSFAATVAATPAADDPPRAIAIHPAASDVISTGNEWIALPTIRASDAALQNFNVLSMHDRGLLQVNGAAGTPALVPRVMIDGKPIQFANLSWELLDYWVPRAHLTTADAEITITYCAPPGSRAAFVEIVLTNKSAKPIDASVGMHASFGSLDRVTYTPVELSGVRAVGPAAWQTSAQVFSFVTSDTKFAWSFDAFGSATTVTTPPASLAPAVDSAQQKTLAPGAQLEAHFVIGVGVEEYSASQSGGALRETIDREGPDAVIARTAAWCRKRTRTTGRADLDVIMNRNLLYTTLYAWGRTIDTEQLVGVTSRSDRYYVSAAYWDRDAMLWSFPGLLDSDPAFAKQALEYALTIQERNTGVHSRFIDGIVLEDGYELDEGAAPLVAAFQYAKATGDTEFLASHRAVLQSMVTRLDDYYDASAGLYTTLHDSQDEYRKQGFNTYDNALVWRVLTDWAAQLDAWGDHAGADAARSRAQALKAAVLKTCVANAPGASGAIFVSATDGKDPILADIPPGSLMRLPALGFIAEDDPLFVRTYDWLHSANYKYSYSAMPYGFPGSYRLPDTTSWSVADHLGLTRGREKALKILLASPWDGEIMSEAIDPSTAAMIPGGGAFATAAGDVGHAICQFYCKPR